MPALLMFPLSPDNYFEIGAFIVSVVTYPKFKGTAYRLFPFFLFFIVLTELAGRYIRTVLHQHNAWLYNFSTTLEFIYYAYVFNRVFQNGGHKHLAILFMRSYPILVLINLAFIQGFSAFHSYTVALGSFFMIIFSCLFFYEMLLNPEELSLHRHPMFWISTGILFFYLGDISYDLWYEALMKYGLDTGRKLFETINNNLVLVLYFCFILAFLCQRNPRSSSYR